MPEKHEQLLLKKLIGNITPEEENAFQAWIQKDVQNRKIYEDYKKIWKIRQSEAPEFSPHGEFLRLNARLDRKKQRSVWFYYREAAAILLLCVATYLIYDGLKDQPQLHKSGKDVLTITLPDSTKVTLKPNSALMVLPDYGVKKRSVILDGQAFFTVSHDTLRPFEVSGKNSQVTVIGTSFIYSARDKSERNEVLVLTGKVKMKGTHFSTSELILSPGTQGILDIRSNALTKQEEDTLNALAWKDKKLTFSKTPLKRVIATLEGYFEIRVRVIDQELLECRFTGTFQDPKIEEVVEALGDALDVVIVREYQGYILEGTGCKSRL